MNEHSMLVLLAIGVLWVLLLTEFRYIVIGIATSCFTYYLLNEYFPSGLISKETMGILVVLAGFIAGCITKCKFVERYLKYKRRRRAEEEERRQNEERIRYQEDERIRQQEKRRREYEERRRRQEEANARRDAEARQRMYYEKRRRMTINERLSTIKQTALTKLNIDEDMVNEIPATMLKTYRDECRSCDVEYLFFSDEQIFIYQCELRAYNNNYNDLSSFKVDMRVERTEEYFYRNIIAVQVEGNSKFSLALSANNIKEFDLSEVENAWQIIQGIQQKVREKKVI